jgi:hypothetical protein
MPRDSVGNDVTYGSPSDVGGSVDTTAAHNKLQAHGCESSFHLVVFHGIDFHGEHE